MYDNLQEERLDNLQEDLVSCIEGEEGHGGRLNKLLLVVVSSIMMNPQMFKVMIKTWMTESLRSFGKKTRN